jgi:hypothetical protein
MANSIITYTGNGVNTQFALNFTLGILDREHVKCRVGSEVDGLGDPVYRTLEWVTDGLVNVQGTVPANGQAVVFTRTVPKDELVHDYENGAAIEESNLDDSNKQSLMAIHEFLDGRLEGGFAQDLTMNGFKITDLGDGTDPEDAVNLAQLEDMTGNAPAYAAAAAASAAAALVSENNAETAETLAQAWATNPEDDDVAGYAGEYSALHWAAKAAASAALLPLNNYVATTAPSVNNDSTEGYSKGSTWIHTTAVPNPEAYICVDASVGAALWQVTTLTATDLGSAAFQSSTAFATAAQGAKADLAISAANTLGRVLYGCVMSNGTDTVDDINISAGSCVSDDGTTVMNLAAITKQLDAAWAVGTNQGGRDTGSIANNTWHVWVINRPDTNVTDVLFSLSATAPTLPTNYTKKKRIGSIIRASGSIRQFVQTGNKFRFKGLVNDVAASAQGSGSRDTRTLSVPVGIVVEAEVSLQYTCPGSSDYGVLVTDLVNDADTAVSLTNATMYIGGNGVYRQGSTILCSTDTSAQIGIRSSVSGGTVNVSTRGWTDWGI